MQPMYYIGLDVQKRKISYCVKDKQWEDLCRKMNSRHLDRWIKTLPQQWSAALEATMNI